MNILKIVSSVPVKILFWTWLWRSSLEYLPLKILSGIPTFEDPLLVTYLWRSTFLKTFEELLCKMILGPFAELFYGWAVSLLSTSSSFMKMSRVMENFKRPPWSPYSKNICCYNPVKILARRGLSSVTPLKKKRTLGIQTLEFRNTNFHCFPMCFGMLNYIGNDAIWALFGHEYSWYVSLIQNMRYFVFW